MTVFSNKPEVNIREKLQEVDRPIGSMGSRIMSAETPAEAFQMIGAGRRNLIINGCFRVTKRQIAATNAVDIHSSQTIVNNAYQIDRWKADISGVTGAARVITVDDLGEYRSKKQAYHIVASSSADGYMHMRQFIEMPVNDFSHSGKTVTASCWIRSNKRVRLRCEAAPYTGSNWDSLECHSGGGGWEKLTMTIPLKGTIGSLIFGVIMWGGNGANDGQTAAIKSGDYFTMTEYQVEYGTHPTPFEYRHYAEEVALCQRYFYLIAEKTTFATEGAVNSSQMFGTLHKWNNTNTFVFLDLPTSMRIRPSLIKSAGSSDFTIKANGYSVTGNDFAIDGDSSGRHIRLNSALQHGSIGNGSSGWARVEASNAWIGLSADY